jgi:hypothetical protein
MPGAAAVQRDTMTIGRNVLEVRRLSTLNQVSYSTL